jgi:hypothetical protein
MRAYSDDLEFYLEASWSPARGLRHALRFYHDATPAVWAQLPKAQTLMAFMVDAPKYEQRGRPESGLDLAQVEEAVDRFWDAYGKAPKQHELCDQMCDDYHVCYTLDHFKDRLRKLCIENDTDWNRLKLPRINPTSPH